MAQFTVNAQRFDPYRNFRFRVKMDGRYVAGVAKVGPLKRSTEVIEVRDGGDTSGSRKSPGRTKYDPITLERGVTHDSEFEAWANAVYAQPSGQGTPLKKYRKDIIIELIDEAGQVAFTYRVFGCWPSEYTALPEMDAATPEVAFETLVLQIDGWERLVPKPTGPAGKRKTRSA